MPRKWAIGTVKTTIASGCSRSTSRSRCRRQRGVTLQPRDDTAGARIGLTLAVGRVRRRAPPRRLDGAAAIRRHDQVDALVVQALPELPPGWRTPVAVVEVDGRGDAQKPGGRHPTLSVAGGREGAVMLRRRRRLQDARAKPARPSA